MGSCIDTIVKYLMLFVNLVFACTGLALVGVGIYVQVALPSEYVAFVSSQYGDMCTAVIIFGAIMVFLSLVGCGSVISKNHCVFKLYATGIWTALLAEFVCACLVFAFRADLRDIIMRRMRDAMGDYGTWNEEEDKMVVNSYLAKSWNYLQREMTCCGATDYKNWAETPFGSKGAVPDSCCKVESAGCGASGFSASAIHTGGCLDSVEDTVESHMLALAVIGICVVVFQLLAIAGAARQIRKRK